MTSPPPLDSRRSLLRWTINVLRVHGIRPSKRLSQSFVVEPGLVREVVGWVGEAGARAVVEIGAGLGTLTYHLALKAPKVYAVEVDPRLARVVEDVTRELGNVEVVVADALEHPIGMGDTVASNVPYHITGPLIARVLRENSFKRAALLLQAEVAAKILASPGSPDYGRLTVFVNYLARAAPGGVYHPSCFYPRPKVYSMLVYLERRRHYDERARAFEELARCLFNQINKMARKIARRCLEKLSGIGVEASLEWLGTRRVRELGLEDLEKLLKHVTARERED